MPKLTVEGRSAEWEASKRLVIAIEEMGVQIGHRCGGNARCTTCRVTFTSGEPATMTEAEFKKLHDAGIYGQYRLACQIRCEQDMEVVPIMTLENQGWTDTGPAPDPEIKPAAEFLPVEQLEARG